MNLSTTYMGFELPHPLIPGAGPLTYSLDSVRRLEDAGAPMIVMHSMFEEQIVQDELSFAHSEYADDSNAEALSLLPQACGVHAGAR